MTAEPTNGGCLGWLMMILMGFFGLVFFGVSAFVPSPPMGVLSITESTPSAVTPASTVYTTRLVFALDPQTAPATLDAITPIFGKRLAALGINSYGLETVPARNEIIVSIGADTDPFTLAEALQQSALLELVDISALGAVDFMGLVGQTVRTDAQAAFGLTLPDDALTPPDGGAFPTIISGDALEEAHAYLEPMSNTWGVSFGLNPQSAAQFGTFTESHIGKPLAIVLDGVILSVPTVQGRIDGQGVISGNFTESEARTLAAQLSAAPLPAPLTLQSVDAIAP